jgi:hypothetical protein
LGEWATVAIATKIMKDVGAKLSPDELSRALKVATQEASAQHPLFYKCAPDGQKGWEKFLQQFFQEKGLVELQKPLNERSSDRGKPDVDVLVAAFRQAEKYDVPHKLDSSLRWNHCATPERIYGENSQHAA